MKHKFAKIHVKIEKSNWENHDWKRGRQVLHNAARREIQNRGVTSRPLCICTVCLFEQDARGLKRGTSCRINTIQLSPRISALAEEEEALAFLVLSAAANKTYTAPWPACLRIGCTSTMKCNVHLLFWFQPSFSLMDPTLQEKIIEVALSATHRNSLECLLTWSVYSKSLARRKLRCLLAYFLAVLQVLQMLILMYVTSSNM